jgi:hypothetical protein
MEAEGCVRRGDDVVDIWGNRFDWHQVASMDNGRRGQ